MRLKILFTGIVISSFLISMTVACQPSFQPADIVDDLGRQITIDKAPQRIVSHVPSITETLFALDLGEKVVGVSEYGDYPEAAKAKPKVGGYYDPSIEMIVDLNPDLVLTDGRAEKLMTQLDNLSIAVIVLQPKDIEGILRNIQLLGVVTDSEAKVNSVIKDMQQRMSYVSTRVKDVPRTKVFYILPSEDLNNPWTAGPGSFVDSLIALAGGENIGAKAVSTWAQFSIEEVVNSDPEVIIVDAKMGTAATPIEELVHHPAWQNTSAVRQGRIHIIDGTVINRSGPRIVQGLEEIAKLVHPELFEE